jgi:hypothetical protein
MQLGKLGCSSEDQRHSCKTVDNRHQLHQWPTVEKQNFPIVVQRDDGMWSLGWHDDAVGPKPTPAPE